MSSTASENMQDVLIPSRGVLSHALLNGFGAGLLMDHRMTVSLPPFPYNLS